MIIVILLLVIISIILWIIALAKWMIVNNSDDIELDKLKDIEKILGILKYIFPIILALVILWFMLP